MASEDPPGVKGSEFQKIVVIADVIKTALRCIATVSIFYLAFDAFKEFAGKISIADLKLIADLKINKWVPALIGILIGGPGFGYGLYQRKLRREYINRYTLRVKHLEQKVDPNRSSSGLTSRGDHQLGD